MSGLARSVELLAEGIARGQHLGAQLYALHNGREIADLALGEVRPGERLETDHLLHWFSSGKPIGAVAVAQLWERVDDPVAAHIPEFGPRGKEAITIRHVLTHMGGFRSRLDLDWSVEGWDPIRRSWPFAATAAL